MVHEFIMAIPKGTKRFQHNITGEVRYFRNPPNLESWSKVGTPGSKNWCWINNSTEERFVKRGGELPVGFSYGRVRA